MDINTSLFDGKLICLAPINYDTDPEIHARWTQDLDFLRCLGTEPARPLSPAQVKKQYEAVEKEMEEGKSSFYFTIRTREDDRLVGFARVYWIEWAHAVGSLQIALGDPQDRGKGYGSDTMALVLRFAFEELNLHRLSAVLGEDNPDAVRFFMKFGFVQEVCRRQALLRQGRTWDIVHLGLLQSEWRS